MSIKSLFDSKIKVFLVSVIILCALIIIGTKIIPLFNPHHLSEKVKCALYTNEVIQYFEQEKLDDFLDSIGYAIFYNESVGNTEEEIYLYSLLSQYYLEIGADKSGFETILHGRRLKNFYKIQNIEIRSQALHAYGRFLLFESDFEDALKAEKQLEDDANVLLQENHLNATHYLRRALAFRRFL